MLTSLAHNSLFYDMYPQTITSLNLRPHLIGFYCCKRRCFHNFLEVTVEVAPCSNVSSVLKPSEDQFVSSVWWVDDTVEIISICELLSATIICKSLCILSLMNEIYCAWARVLAGVLQWMCVSGHRCLSDTDSPVVCRRETGKLCGVRVVKMWTWSCSLPQAETGAMKERRTPTLLGKCFRDIM